MLVVFLMFFRRTFKSRNSFAKRTLISTRIKDANPSRFPVVIESRTLKLSKSKFLVSGEMKLSEFMRSVRQYTATYLQPENSLFLLTETGILIPMVATIEYAFLGYSDKDGILYFNLEEENTFG